MEVARIADVVATVAGVGPVADVTLTCLLVAVFVGLVVLATRRG